MRNFYAKIHKKLMTRKNVFLQIPVRTGYRTISTNIMETLVVMESDSKIERRKCAKIFQFIGNTLFGRKWSLSTDNDKEEEHEVGEISSEEVVGVEPLRKKRKKIGDLRFLCYNQERPYRHGCSSSRFSL